MLNLTGEVASLVSGLGQALIKMQLIAHARGEEEL